MTKMFTQKWSYYFNEKNRASTLNLLKQNPSILNEFSGETYLCEYLIIHQEYELLQNFLHM